MSTEVRLGLARRGLAMRGAVWQGRAWFGSYGWLAGFRVRVPGTRFGLVWCGKALLGRAVLG